MRLGRRVAVAMSVVLLALVLGASAEQLVEVRRDDRREALRTRWEPAREELAALLTALVDQETGQRGFLLTGDEAFLEPYLGGRDRTTRAIARLRQLLEDEPSLIAGVERVRSRISAWQQLGGDFEVDALREGRGDLVEALVSSGTSKRLFEQARAEMAALEEDLVVARDEGQAELDRLERLVDAIRLAILLLVGALLLVTGILLARWVTVPVAHLGAAVRRAASGALREPISAEGPPELVELAADVDAMRRRLLAEVDDAARARDALADRGMIVVTLRDALAPGDISLPRGLEMAGRFRPAKGLVAGDWYDVVRLDEHRIGLALVDVSGHGAEVASFALRTKALTMAALGSLDPGAAFAWLAEQLGDTGDLFLTGVVAEIDSATGRIGYASAGHPPLLLAGIHGVEQLPPTGPLLGPFGAAWETVHADLQHGGVLVAYSDGILEARDGDRHMFGVERLAAVVADTQLAGAAAVADACLEAVELFADGGGHDDITLCVVAR